MASHRAVELMVGLFVALGLVALFYLALRVSNVESLGNRSGYRVEARFADIGSLRTQAPVTLAGVRIGRVTDIRLDLVTFEAVVVLTIDERYDQLPADSSASILTAGILGEQYVGIEPGGLDEYLSADDQIEITQPALILENLIGRFITRLGQQE